MRSSLLVVFGLSFALIGCPDKPQPSAADSGTEAAEIDAGPAAPAPLAISLRFDVPDAGIQPVVLEAGVKTTVPQPLRIELESNQLIRNYRVRVFDEIDKVVPSTDSAEELPSSIRYLIGFDAPLKTGYRYALVLDAQTGAAMLDAQGQPLSDLRYEFVVAGDRQKPEPAPKKKPAPKKRRK